MGTGTDTADVAVVGGGPAGSICALALAHGGARVTLVHWGGYAVSGIELVSGHARHLIERYSPDFFRERMHGVEIQQTISLWGTSAPLTFDAMFSPWGAGVAVDRPALDGAFRRLACEAGVSLVEGAKVEAVTRNDEVWRLAMRPQVHPAMSPCDLSAGASETLLLGARYLVLATGRAANRFFDRPCLFDMGETPRIALMTSLHVQDTCVAPALYIEAVAGGWWYALPATPDRYFAGLCIERDALRRRGIPLKPFFMQELQRTRLLGPLLRHAAPDEGPLTGRNAGAVAYASVAGNGWLAVGDAAYAPDPLSGMGMELAVESGQLGAQAVLEALANGGRSKGEMANFSLYEESIRRIADRHARTGAHHYGQVYSLG